MAPPPTCGQRFAQAFSLCYGNSAQIGRKKRRGANRVQPANSKGGNWWQSPLCKKRGGGRPGTASQFQRRELVAVPALRLASEIRILNVEDGLDVVLVAGQLREHLGRRGPGSAGGASAGED